MLVRRVYTCAHEANFPISSDVIYIPSVVRALKSLVITLLWTLSNRTTPIYHTSALCLRGRDGDLSRNVCLHFMAGCESYISQQVVAFTA